MATQVASLTALLKLDDADFKKGLNSAKSGLGGLGDSLESIGGKVTKLGAGMTVVTAPLAVGLGLATQSALNFDKSMTNVQAVLGKTDDEMKALNAEVLAMGRNSVAGPQAVADAFYDIVGGVADSSTHMDILAASIATAEAGAADLGGTTNALISIMNSYKLTADQASYASDVLTRTVGMGVGTMDEFASALPQATGLANSLGISFEDLGAMTAYLTTQGNSASQSVTQLSAMMTSMLNPNQTMKDALKELGFASGEAAIKQLGLVGAFQAVAGTTTIAENGMAKATGSVEALRGATALATPEWQTFSTTFVNGVNGATEAARNIQLDSASAQFSLLQSEMSALAIEVGDVLLPILLDLVEQIKPVITQVMDWVQKNPQATQTIVALTAAVVVLGPIITALGAAISIIGTVISGATAVMGIFSAGITALGTYAGVTTVSLGAMLVPIAAVTAAAVAAVAALKSVLDFHAQVSAAAGQAQSEVAALQAGGANITRQQLDDQAFSSISGQFGGGILGDLAARLTYSNAADAVQGDTVMAGSQEWINTPLGRVRANSRDSGGAGMPGVPYAIGTGAQPEVFVPDTAGQFYPNGGGDMGGITIENMTVVAANVQDFEQQMRDRRRSRG